MRRFSVLLSVVVAVLLGITALTVRPAAVAQEATPAGDEMEGVSFEPVTFATGVDLTGLSELLVVRIGLEPGTALPIEPDPGVGILLIESGTVTVQAEAPMTVTRGAELGEAMAAAEETGDFSTLMESITAGEVVTLEAGDAAYIPGSVAGEIRNEGQERAVALGFLVVPPEDMTGQATPTP